MTAHKLATIANNHGIVGLGPYPTAALRRAAPLTSADVGKVAQQTDTDPATYWIVLKVVSGVGTWSRVDTGAESVFSGDFSSFFTGVLHYLRSDLGISQTAGNITGWTAQVGPNITPATGSTYIGTVATGLNGHASILADGSTHGGQYTLARPGASAGTPTFMWAVWRMISATNTPSRIFSDQNASMGMFINNGTTNLYLQGNSTVGPVTAAANAWGRSEAQFSNQASDYVKFGSGVSALSASGNTVPNSLRGIFCTNLGAGKINAELLCYIMLDNIPTGPQLAAASAAVTTFYGGSVAV